MMFLAQLFVKMPHAEIEVLLAIEVQHLLDDLHFNAPRAGPRPPPVIQPVEAHAAISVQQPPQMPRADRKILAASQNVSCLLHNRKITSSRFMARSRALAGYLMAVPPACWFTPLGPLLERTFHLLIPRTYHVLTTGKNAGWRKIETEIKELVKRWLAVSG